MKDEQLVSILDELISRNTSGGGDQLASNREAALDAYFQRNTIPAPEGRSQVVGGVISSTVDAVLANMLSAITTQNAVAFDPLGPEDEENAQLESEVVNDFVMNRNPGYYNFSCSIKDSLLSRTAIQKIFLDEKTSVKREQYKELSGIEMQQAVQPSAPNQQVEITSFDDDGNLSLKRTDVFRELVITTVPPENFIYEKNWDSIYLKGCPFVAERKVYIRSVLLEMGFPKSKVEMIPAGNDQSSFGGDSAARNPGGQTRQPQGVQKATDEVQVWEIYAMIDMDNSGKAELYRIMYGGYPNGGEILSKEPAEFIPYAVGTAFVVPHRLNRNLAVRQTCFY